MTSGSDDPLAGLLGSARRQKKRTTDISFGKRDKPSGEKGLNPLDILALPAAQRDAINWLSRRKQATLDQLQEALKKPAADLGGVLTELKRAGYVREALIEGQIYYRVVFGGKISRSGRGMPQGIWDAVDLDNTVFLKRLSIFAHLDDDKIKSIAEMAEARHYQRNEIIAWQGNVEQDILFIKNGIVGITRLLPGSSEETQILAYLNEGEILGETNLLVDGPIVADTTASALSKVDVLAFPRDKFLEIAKGDRRVALELARLILKRLMATNERMVATSGDNRLAMVFSVGENSGSTLMGCALALTLAHVAQAKAVYTEHPRPESLAKLFELPAGETFHEHRSRFDIATVETAPGLPLPVRTTLVMDELVEHYDNIVIGVKGDVDESVNYMLEQANQIVIIFSPEDTVLPQLEALVTQLRAAMHPEKTNLFVVVNHRKPGLGATTLPLRVDYEIPYFGDEAVNFSDLSLETLPEPVRKVAELLADRLGRTNQIGIYLPDAVDDPAIDIAEQVQAALSFLGGIFGGATATTTEAQGATSGDDETATPDSIHIIRTYVTKADLERYLSKVLAFVEETKLKLGQDALALEVNAKMMLI